MYYDKRFQKDPHFPLIAFNHEQMKESTTAGYLTWGSGPLLCMARVLVHLGKLLMLMLTIMLHIEY
jgi:hypothetical protein